jgi:hypothetical protein
MTKPSRSLKLWKIRVAMGANMPVGLLTENHAIAVNGYITTIIGRRSNDTRRS